MTFCELCKQRFSTEEDFMNHCFTVEHRRLIFEDGSAQWKHRDPPQTYKNLKLCERSLTCEYGDNCTKAHSKEELKEWKKRIKDVQKRAKDASDQGLLSYQDDLLEEYRQSKDKEKIVSDFIDIPDVSVTCDSDLDCVYVRDTGIPNTWNFTITSKEPLEVVALLRRNIGAKFTLNRDHHTEQTYSTGDWFLTESSTDPKVYEVPVSFTSDRLGVYEQWLVFDFNMRPVLRMTLKIRVGKDMERCAEKTSDLTPEPKGLRRRSALLPVNFEPWSEERMKIIHFPQREEAERELLNKYKLVLKHQMNRPITRENYKESMHSFLYQEEKKEAELLARLNQRGSMQLRKHLSDMMFGLKIAPEGELFASVDLSQSLTPDTPQGYIMKRNAVRILVHVVETDDHHTPVYETKLIKDTATDSATETQIHILLSKQCCSDLNLQNEQKGEIEVQFHLNRLWFCQMHKAIDDLPNLDQVLPNLKNCSIQVSDQSDIRDLNEHQKAAVNFIQTKTDNRTSVPPLLIYGPFGTGKTLTLAKMAQVLVQQPSNKILICTHTNSSADLYVLRHFHTFVTDHPEATLKPLRVKTKEKNLKSTDLITLQYCHLSKDGSHFEFPDKAVLDSKRIIITTTAMACYFHNMRLPENYFSHILIDEASQMLECEALMALGLAGKKTRVVLAGDHMQMGPKLFSVTQDKCSQYTLLNRLFYHYQAENSSAAKQSRIIFTENYRSTKDIVDFVSTHFYVGKSDVIKARGDVPSHPDQHALQFRHVRGKCYLDSTRSSWFNHEESQSVVDIVKGIISNWPAQWCEQDSTSICVLSQGAQVYTIRHRLRDLGLARITVENAENVQGKQFRVIVISTVHTKDSLLGIDQSYLEFFNDMRVLNTVMTRAQSQIVVVGDAAALSSPHFGTCWRLWRSYIEHCINKESAYDLVEDFWKQDLLDISELYRSEDDGSSDCESITSEISDIHDPILQELLDESNDINISLTEEGLFTVSHERVVGNLVSRNKEVGAEQQCGLNIHKCCEMVTERFDRGYAIPLDEPTKRIDIRGRQNMGQSFPGDKVLVEILNEHPPIGKVIQVLESADTLKEFVCTLERHDSQVMRPINNRISNIFTPFYKDKQNHIAVRNPGDHTIQKFFKINEETRRNYLFVVRICQWRKGFRLPLGVVVRVFHKVASLEDSLDVLDIEFQLRRTLSEDVKRKMLDFQDFQVFEDGRKDFRGLPTFTIDSEVSKDLDDAISVNDLGDCYEIGVHISDVATFVRKDSELDKYARKQGTTFYPPDREPRYMFPRELSVNFFSLIPGEDRKAISLIIEVDKKTDHIKKRSFVKSIICSKRRFSYSEVDDILEKQVDSQHFDLLEVCLVIACHFADVHRKYRKQKDWHYKSPDENVPIGRRRSHRMVEELMIMFNHTAAEWLLYDETTRSLTPLRCQESPKSIHIQNLLDKNPILVHLSVHLLCQADATRVDSQTMRGQSLSRHYASTSNPMADVSETFPILISLLTSLKAAARDKDIYRIIDLITTDDIHPQLLPFAIAFRQLFQKSYFLRSNSTYASRIGHSDLNLDSYTQASSPIRRYVDIIVQRLLHSVIDKTDVSYTSNDINLSCVEFSRNNEHQSAYDKKAHALYFASKLSTQHERKVAYIVEVIPSGTNFKVSFPLNRASMPDKTGIMYRDLQLADQPEYDERNNVILKWVRRIYSFSNPDIHAELQKQSSDSILAYVPAKFWQKLVAAIREEKWNSLFDLIKDLDVDSTTHGKQFQEHSRRTEGHYAKLSLRLKEGEAVEVQLGTTTAFTMMTPVVQVFVVHPKFELCMEHVRDPIKCFSEYVFRSSRDSYNTFVEYQKIWEPLCQMESVFNAVAENESIVLEDVALKWTSSHQEKLQGLFVLPLDKKKQWSIECDFKNCFLCIRRRNCKSKCSPVRKNITDLTNNPSVIWVSHGVVTKVEGTESSDLQIAFQINHMAMTNIPEEIFCEDTRFTVELIPELLPDVRKKKAIDSLNDANQLVRNIAMGKKVNSERGSLSWDQMPTRFEIQHPAFRFSLNKCQHEAIREALTNPFTLIQGPPGTGKTVVGVHIVFWLLKKIQALAGCNFQKKRAILYCGPSNKSVDVVAGHLLKLNQTRPLRVYSDQMEMLEFPYPGCSLKLSRQSKRAEKPNTELSSIALHHLIRKDGNPFSKEIKDFDKRIQRAEQLTKEEISCYKDLIIKAREHELLQHDVILCTCTAASHPLLAEALDIKQIIIDECAMATEPEAFIPLVTHKPEQIVLLGDHMQLQPVVHCDVVARLGMNKSLFERYMEKALMLDTQYRMQEAICAFPSEEFYGGQLKTKDKTNKPGPFLNEAQKQTHIIFGHVEGKEISLVVSTERGNENSKANVEEAKETVRIAKDLIQAGIHTRDIAILTPYNAQVSNISEMLFKEGMCDITVTTIMKSQGSEWKYVILSTVRSCPQSDIEPQPTKSWITSRLGFITDRHQVNVGITRAQEGLCIIGNENLLRCSALWRKLLDRYQKKRCVMNPASNIQVQKPQSGPMRMYRR